MKAGNWERVKEILHHAMQLAPEQRTEFLDGSCGSNAALREEVESLLLADNGLHPGFLLSPPMADKWDSVANGIDHAAGLSAGQIIAQRFQLVRKLGAGGMGQVWLAEQTSPVKRQVALKLIKAGMYDESVVQRFEAERQSLAIMDHPAIAKVFDAGTTPQGQPYFVMEFVQGLPITEYCDLKKLKIPDRLEIFIQACEAVQHAHQKAIIHRDLKPANILVADVDGKPTPRIIDFGLAKAITPQTSDEPHFTKMGIFMGTPGYMSPEQADPSVRDIDTRTDVYSLGVVLYVLLAGLQPFDTKQQQKFPLDELLRKLRVEEPPTPSTRVGGNRMNSAGAAEARGTEPRQLVKILRGDLDWITMKALEKDRARRYGTASDLASDIRHYLNHEPVVARPANISYQFRKYVRRHRVAAAVVSSLVIVLLSFSVLQALQLRRITHERDRANRERDRANRIAEFMTSMFKVSDPSQSRGNTITAREILDKASNDLNTGLAKDPEVQSQMMQDMARTYENLGLYPRAHELAQRALDSRLSLIGPDDPKTLEVRSQLGYIVDREGHYADSEKMLRQALDVERRVLGADNPLTLETMGHLGVVLGQEGRNEDGAKLDREAIEVGSKTLGPESELVMQTTLDLGVALWNEARYPEAEHVFRQLVDVERRVLGADDLQTMKALGDLGLALKSQGRLAEAEPLYRDVLAKSQRVLGPEHPETAFNLDRLANLLSEEGHPAEAEKLTREELAIRLRALGPEHTRTLIAKINLSDELLKEGHSREAEKLQREALAVQVRIRGPENADSLIFKTYLAKSLNKEGRYAEAEKLARETYEFQRRDSGSQHTDTIDTLRELGKAMAYTHRYGDAYTLFQDVIQNSSNSAGQGNSWSVWYAFACTAAAAGHTDDAFQFLHEARDRGYTNANALTADDDLQSLRRDSRFEQLVNSLKNPASSLQTQ
jgi:non-specific serine/threonine protein kinase/serine/threonine-protein kinase